MQSDMKRSWQTICKILYFKFRKERQDILSIHEITNREGNKTLYKVYLLLKNPKHEIKNYYYYYHNLLFYEEFQHKFNLRHNKYQNWLNQKSNNQYAFLAYTLRTYIYIYISGRKYRIPLPCRLFPNRVQFSLLIEMFFTVTADASLMRSHN